SAAHTSYRQALRFLEKNSNHPHVEDSKISLSKNRLDLYEALICLTASAPETESTSEAIFDLMEKARARELAELLAFRANTLPTPSRNRSSLVEQVRASRDQLNWYYRQVAAAEFGATDNSVQQAEDLRRRIRGQEEVLLKTLREIRPTEEEFHALQNASTIPIRKIRSAIREDEVILEYCEVRGLLHACLLRHDTLRIVPITPSETIRSMLRSLQSQLSKLKLGDAYIHKFASSLLGEVQANLMALHRE